jgi:hypothetical protein
MKVPAPITNLVFDMGSLALAVQLNATIVFSARDVTIII